MSVKLKSIKAERFLVYNTVPCDIYMKLNDKKYIKVVKADSPIDRPSIEKYQKRGVEDFFVSKEGLELINELGGKVLAELNKAEVYTEDLSVAKDLWSLEIIYEQARSLGITEEVIETTNRMMDESINKLESDPTLKDLFDSIMRQKDYIIEHSLLLNYIMIDVCKKVQWNSEATFKKFALASLLHDSVLEDPDKAKLRTKDKIDETHYTRAEKKVISEHPNVVAELITKSSITLPDVDTIILQHHEQPDGSGFPRGLNSTHISPLACLFIMGEEFVDKVYGKEISYQSTISLVEVFEKKFNKGNFRKILPHFIDFIKSVPE